MYRVSNVHVFVIQLQILFVRSFGGVIPWLMVILPIESVDSISRDGPDMLIYVIQHKNLENSAQVSLQPLNEYSLHPHLISYPKHIWKVLYSSKPEGGKKCKIFSNSFSLPCLT